MLHFWLSVFIKTFWDTVNFVGQTKTGIVFLVLVFVISILWQVKNIGWREAMKHWLKTSGEGVVITFIAFVLIGLAHFIYEPFHLLDDERARKVGAVNERDYAKADRATCEGELKTDDAKVELLGRQVASQQTLISSQQATANTQQSTFNLCVATLAKTNVPVPLKITALSSVDDIPPQELSKHRLLMVVIPSKVVTPINMLIGCERPIKDIEIKFANNSMYSGGKQKATQDGRAWILSVSFPAMAPESPLLVRLMYDVDDVGACWTKQQ